jgi:hypothetical protein
MYVSCVNKALTAFYSHFQGTLCSVPKLLQLVLLSHQVPHGTVHCALMDKTERKLGVVGNLKKRRLDKCIFPIPTRPAHCVTELANLAMRFGNVGLLHITAE